MGHTHQIFKMFLVEEKQSLISIDNKSIVIIWDLAHRNILRQLQLQAILDAFYDIEENSIIIVFQFNRIRTYSLENMIN